jgi:hypothetical protein
LEGERKKKREEKKGKVVVDRTYGTSLWGGSKDGINKRNRCVYKANREIKE